MPCRIALVYDLQPPHAPADHWAEWDRPETVAAIAQGLSRLGHTVCRVESAHAFRRQLETLQRTVDLVFSLAEGRHSRTREAQVPTLCEFVGLPYVGSTPPTLALALDKWMTKRLWQAEGLPTPPGACVARLEALDSVRLPPLPLIVKPRYEGSGMGVDVDAVVHDAAHLRRRVAWTLTTYDEPVLVEAFIRGGEVTVCLLGDPLEALPPVQRHVDPTTTLSCHIVHQSWRAPAPQWQLPLTMTPTLEQRCRDLALRAAQALACRDVARVDLRVDATGRPWLLEVNPLPALDSESTFALLADTLGWGFPGLLQRILEPAIKRFTVSGNLFQPSRHFSTGCQQNILHY